MIQTYTGQLVVIECCNCHMVFGMTAEFNQACVDAGHRKLFYCPAGHDQHYTQGEIAKLKAQLARAQDRADMAEIEARSAEYRRRAAVGQNTKLRKRIAAGVCPCCQRTFQDLARHMAGQHPGYEQEAPDAG